MTTQTFLADDLTKDRLTLDLMSQHTLDLQWLVSCLIMNLTLGKGEGKCMVQDGNNSSTGVWSFKPNSAIGMPWGPNGEFMKVDIFEWYKQCGTFLNTSCSNTRQRPDV